MSIFNFQVNRNFANKPEIHFPITHYSIIPVFFGSQAALRPTPEGRVPSFQHSNCEQSEQSSSPNAWESLQLSHAQPNPVDVEAKSTIGGRLLCFISNC